jgi:hypothetical protein
MGVGAVPEAVAPVPVWPPSVSTPLVQLAGCWVRGDWLALAGAGKVAQL